MDKKNIEGSGVGLALSKSLTELMGGQIGVESTASKGSCFWLQFPQAHINRNHFKRLQEPHNPSLMDNDNLGASKKILYVEDNPANLKLVAHILSSRKDVNFGSSPLS